MTLKDCESDVSLVDLLAALPNDDPWNDAELYSIYEYARCSKRLCMPRELKEALIAPS